MTRTGLTVFPIIDFPINFFGILSPSRVCFPTGGPKEKVHKTASFKPSDRSVTRSGHHDEDISPLYDIEDETGVLNKHRSKMIGPFMEHQVDMKIMYYELIKMLMEHDKNEQSEEEYNVTRTVHKIEGYQQLTNKLQRHMNSKFLAEISAMNNKFDLIMNNFGDINIMAKFKSLEQNFLHLQQENQTLLQRVISLDSMSSKFSDEYRNNVESKLMDLSGTKERLEKTIVMIGDNKNTLNQLIEKTDKHEDDLKSLKDANSVATSTVETFFQNLNVEIQEKMDSGNAEIYHKIDSIKENQKEAKKDVDDSVAILFENVAKVKQSVESNEDKIKSLQDDMGSMSEKQDELRYEVNVSNDTIQKNVENILKIEKLVGDLDTRTTETVERMKEVTLMTVSVDKKVQVLQDKMTTENKEAFDKIEAAVSEISMVQDELKEIRNDFDVKHKNLDGSVRTFVDSIDGIKSNFDEKLNDAGRNLGARLDQLETEGGDIREKVVLLEEGHNNQVSRLSLMDTFGSRLSVMEEARQQSSVQEDLARKTRQDLEEGLGARLDTVREELDEVKRQVEEQKLGVETSLGELRGQGDGNRQEVVRLVERTEELRTAVLREVETRVQERISEVTVLVKEVEERTKEAGSMIKADYKDEMNSIGNQLNTIYKDYEKMEKDLDDFKTKLGSEMGDLSQSDKDLSAKIVKTDEKMNTIIDQAGKLMMNDATQDEALKDIIAKIKSLEEKHFSLEEADTFLQEAQRQITEKTSSVEDNANKSLDDIQKKVNQILDLKEELKKLEGDQNDFSSRIESLEEKVVLVEGQIVNLEDDQNKQIIKQNKEVEKLTDTDANIRDELQKIKDDFSKDLENIRNKENTLDSGFEDMLNRSTADKESFEEELKEVKERMVQLEFKTENSRAVETLSAKIHDLTTEKDAINSKASKELENLKDKIQELETDFISSSEKLTNLDSYAQGVNIKIEELENSLREQIHEVSQSSSEQFRQIETHETVMSQVSERVAIIERETSSLEANMDRNAAEETNKLRREVEEKIVDLTNRDSETQKRFQTIVESIEQNSQRVADTSAKLVIYDQEKSLVVSKVEDQRETIEKIFAEIETLSNSHTELQNVRDSHKSQISLLGENFESRVGELQNHLSSLDADLQTKLHSRGKCGICCILVDRARLKANLGKNNMQILNF